MESKIEKLEDGNYNYVKKVVTLEEEVWSEDQFLENYSKLKEKIRELKEKIAPIEEELNMAKDMEEEFIKHIPEPEPEESELESEEESEPEPEEE